MAVESHKSAPRLHHGQGGFVDRHNRITTQHQIGFADIYFGGVDGAGRIGNLDMAPCGAAFLRQTGGILRDHGFAFQVRGHAQQRTNGDDPGAAHARHHNAPGLGCIR